MNTNTIQIFLRISSRFLEAFYGFFILIFLNRVLPNSELDYFQISFFIIGIAFLIFDFGRLQHIILENNISIKREYLSVRLYFFILLSSISLLLDYSLATLILLSIFDIGAKNNLYDYGKLKNSFIYFILNLLKLLFIIYLYFTSFSLWILMVFLVVSIFISHFNHRSFTNFKGNIYSFFTTNTDFANFALQIIVIVKSLLIYLVLSRVFNFDSSESRSILFLSNVCFTISMIINSSIINIVPNFKLKFITIPSVLLSPLVGASLLLLYQFVPELRLPYSNFAIFFISAFAFLLNLLTYFLVTKLVLLKKSKILFKYYSYALLFLIFGMYIIYLYNFKALIVILLFEAMLFFMILANYKYFK